MSAPSWAVPGAKVVCVDASPQRDDGVVCNHLSEGSVYTIAEVLVEPAFHYRTDIFGQYVCLVLIGVERDCEVKGFHIDRFRPVVSKTIEDDIALFKHLLNTTPASEDA